MDFMNRGNRPVQQNTQPDLASPEAHRAPARKQTGVKDGKLSKISFIGFIAVITILIIAVVLSLVLKKDNVINSESSKVDHSKLQAVFLNGGQVYFGKISDLNGRSVTLGNIYYLRVNQQVQPNQTNTTANADDISLVKLGCELHGPEDSMVINREQVIFWENLKTDGQVAKAVDEYVKNNPNGQKCTTGTGASTGTGTGTTTGTGTGAATGTGTSTTGR